VARFSLLCRAVSRSSQHRVERRRYRASTGFTLVELMIVVAIVSVLATVAIYGVTKYTRSAKASEATETLAAIRVAQELYRQETFVYLDVSAGSLANLHPRSTPDGDKVDFGGDGDDAALAARFRELGVETSGPVYFSYGVVAGRAGESFPEVPTEKTDFNFPADPADPFYVAIAKGDLDGDGNFSYFLTHSLSSEVYMENEGE
jgi:prepilin-type N-terminal cleavage/methylation domain-containing protein